MPGGRGGDGGGQRPNQPAMNNVIPALFTIHMAQQTAILRSQSTLSVKANLDIQISFYRSSHKKVTRRYATWGILGIIT